MRDIRRGDEGVYLCRAESFLGQVNASAKLYVFCKSFFFLKQTQNDFPNAGSICALMIMHELFD